MKTRKAIEMTKSIWTSLGVAVFVFFLLEVSFSLAFRTKDNFFGSATAYVDPRENADAYEDRTWVASYYREFARSQVAQWRPYVYWRQQPFEGEYINISKSGFRVTPSPLPLENGSSPPIRIYMFGGSTLWGTGARDSRTIPAIVATRLAEKGVSAEVTNLGESGYVSTQEVIELLVQLQAEKSPDFVVFYDGVNDTFSAYQQGVAGIPQNEFNRIREFNLSGAANRQRLWSIGLGNSFQDLSTVRFLRGLSRRIGVMERDIVMHSSITLSDEQVDVLARDVVVKHERNMQMAHALGGQFGFKVLSYWQPTIFQKPHLTEYERSWFDFARPMQAFFMRTYAFAQAAKAGQQVGSGHGDLSPIFSGSKAPLYVDWCHLAERGNDIIATRMANDILLHLYGK